MYQDIRIIQDNAREGTKSFAELCRLAVSEYRDNNFVRIYKYYFASVVLLPPPTVYLLEGVTAHSPAPHNNHEENERHNFIFNVFNVDV